MRQLKKLDPSQHQKTRKLWEEVFREDTKDFLDYYYSFVVKKNNIFTVEIENEIVSMLHLNPYNININNEQYPMHYIVAVSTLEKHRKQGMMRQLLLHSLNELYLNMEPLVYLMPAAEAIYRPYDFVSVYEQPHYIFDEQCSFLEYINMKFERDEKYYNKIEIKAQYANLGHVEELSEYAQKHLPKQYNLYTEHDVSYFEQLLHEQKSQNGGIIIFTSKNKIVGYCLIAKEDEEFIREVIYDDSTTLHHLFEELDKEHILKIKEKTKIMIRPIHMETYLNTMIRVKKINETLYVKDDIIQENSGCYRVQEVEGDLRFEKLCDEIYMRHDVEINSVSDIVLKTMNSTNVLMNEIV